MTRCLFASDLHGDAGRYGKLFASITDRRADAVFLGGDLLPPAWCDDGRAPEGFVSGYLADALQQLRARLGSRFPRVMLILGNDDARAAEGAVRDLERRGLVEYIHQRSVSVGRHEVHGYAYVPPTPFPLKDWERYDVSRYVDPGCLSPEEGVCSVPISDAERRHSTIERDLARLAGTRPLDQAVFLFHAPPHDTCLDRAGLDGIGVEGVMVDLHVGSIAIRRFIEQRQPLLTLHGHIHESARLSGAWRDRIGRTHLLSAAHDGAQLALVQFTLEQPEEAARELL